MSNDWLASLSIDDLPNPTCSPNPKRPTKRLAPKDGRLKRIKGESKPFIPSTSPGTRVPIRTPPRMVGEYVKPIYRKFWVTTLEKVKYKPIDMLGISPFWPEHVRLNRDYYY